MRACHEQEATIIMEKKKSKISGEKKEKKDKR